jgi:hypothetical protein
MQPNSELQFTKNELQFTHASAEVLARFAMVPEKSEELPAPAAESRS